MKLELEATWGALILKPGLLPENCSCLSVQGDCSQCSPHFYALAVGPGRVCATLREGMLPTFQTLAPGGTAKALGDTPG